MHLRLELLDMQLFSGAVAELGELATPVIERAVAGARELDQLTVLIEAS